MVWLDGGRSKSTLTVVPSALNDKNSVKDDSMMHCRSTGGKGGKNVITSSTQSKCKSSTTSSYGREVVQQRLQQKKSIGFQTKNHQLPSSSSNSITTTTTMTRTNTTTPSPIQSKRTNLSKQSSIDKNNHIKRNNNRRYTWFGGRQSNNNTSTNSSNTTQPQQCHHRLQTPNHTCSTGRTLLADRLLLLRSSASSATVPSTDTVMTTNGLSTRIPNEVQKDDATKQNSFPMTTAALTTTKPVIRRHINNNNNQPKKKNKMGNTNNQVHHPTTAIRLWSAEDNSSIQHEHDYQENKMSVGNQNHHNSHLMMMTTTTPSQLPIQELNHRLARIEQRLFCQQEEGAAAAGVQQQLPTINSSKTPSRRLLFASTTSATTKQQQEPQQQEYHCHHPDHPFQDNVHAEETILKSSVGSNYTNYTISTTSTSTTPTLFAHTKRMIQKEGHQVKNDSSLWPSSSEEAEEQEGDSKPIKKEKGDDELNTKLPGSFKKKNKNKKKHQQQEQLPKEITQINSCQSSSSKSKSRGSLLSFHHTKDDNAQSTRIAGTNSDITSAKKIIPSPQNNATVEMIKMDNQFRDGNNDTDDEEKSILTCSLPPTPKTSNSHGGRGTTTTTTSVHSYSSSHPPPPPPQPQQTGTRLLPIVTDANNATPANPPHNHDIINPLSSQQQQQQQQPPTRSSFLSTRLVLPAVLPCIGGTGTTPPLIPPTPLSLDDEDYEGNSILAVSSEPINHNHQGHHHQQQHQLQCTTDFAPATATAANDSSSSRLSVPNNLSGVLSDLSSYSSYNDGRGGGGGANGMNSETSVIAPTTTTLLAPKQSFLSSTMNTCHYNSNNNNSKTNNYNAATTTATTNTTIPSLLFPNLHCPNHHHDTTMCHPSLATTSTASTSTTTTKKEVMYEDDNNNLEIPLRGQPPPSSRTIPMCGGIGGGETTATTTKMMMISNNHPREQKDDNVVVTLRGRTITNHDVVAVPSSLPRQIPLVPGRLTPDVSLMDHPDHESVTEEDEEEKEDDKYNNEPPLLLKENRATTSSYPQNPSFPISRLSPMKNSSLLKDAASQNKSQPKQRQDREIGSRRRPSPSQPTPTRLMNIHHGINNPTLSMLGITFLPKNTSPKDHHHYSDDNNALQYWESMYQNAGNTHEVLQDLLQTPTATKALAAAEIATGEMEELDSIEVPLLESIQRQQKHGGEENPVAQLTSSPSLSSSAERTNPDGSIRLFSSSSWSSSSYSTSNNTSNKTERPLVPKRPKLNCSRATSSVNQKQQQPKQQHRAMATPKTTALSSLSSPHTQKTRNRSGTTTTTTPKIANTRIALASTKSISSSNKKQPPVIVNKDIEMTHWTHDTHPHSSPNDAPIILRDSMEQQHHHHTDNKVSHLKTTTTTTTTPASSSHFATQSSSVAATSSCIEEDALVDILHLQNSNHPTTMMGSGKIQRYRLSPYHHQRNKTDDDDALSNKHRGWFGRRRRRNQQQRNHPLWGDSTTTATNSSSRSSFKEEEGNSMKHMDGRGQSMPVMNSSSPAAANSSSTITAETVLFGKCSNKQGQREIVDHSNHHDGMSMDRTQGGHQSDATSSSETSGYDTNTENSTIREEEDDDGNDVVERGNNHCIDSMMDLTSSISRAVDETTRAASIIPRTATYDDIIRDLKKFEAVVEVGNDSVTEQAHTYLVNKRTVVKKNEVNKRNDNCDDESMLLVEMPFGLETIAELSVVDDDHNSLASTDSSNGQEEEGAVLQGTDDLKLDKMNSSVSFAEQLYRLEQLQQQKHKHDDTTTGSFGESYDI